MGEMGKILGSPDMFRGKPEREQDEDPQETREELERKAAAAQEMMRTEERSWKLFPRLDRVKHRRMQAEIPEIIKELGLEGVDFDDLMAVHRLDVRRYESSELAVLINESSERDWRRNSPWYLVLLEEIKRRLEED